MFLLSFFTSCNVCCSVQRLGVLYICIQCIFNFFVPFMFIQFQFYLSGCGCRVQSSTSPPQPNLFSSTEAQILMSLVCTSFSFIPSHQIFSPCWLHFSQIECLWSNSLATHTVLTNYYWTPPHRERVQLLSLIFFFLFSTNHNSTQGCPRQGAQPLVL